VPGFDVRRIAEATSPRGDIVLTRRDGAEGPILELRVNGVYVMDTRETSSEVALADAALAASASPARVLVGGLGLGFTAAEVLRDPRVHELVVVEIEEPVVDWMRTGTVPHGPALLADPRLDVVVANLRDFLAAPGTAFDLVLLDVDNGPGNLVHAGNARLYDGAGLEALREVTTPGGTVAIWSASPAPELLTAMSTVIGPARELACPVHPDTHPTDYYLYTATRGHRTSPGYPLIATGQALTSP